MRAFFLFSVLMPIIISACKTLNISERGMQGSELLGNSSLISHKNTGNPTLLSDPYFAENNVREAAVKYAADKNETINKYVAPENNLQTLENKRLLSHAVKSQNPNKAAHFIKRLNNKHTKDNPEEGSIQWFIYFLLCFLIPPLAYYLIKRTSDTLFWVCFICYLMTLSFFGGFRYGILGLLSIVIALLALFQIDI